MAKLSAQIPFYEGERLILSLLPCPTLTHLLTPPSLQKGRRDQAEADKIREQIVAIVAKAKADAGF